LLIASKGVFLVYMPNTVTLPPIRIPDLPEVTKNYLLAVCQTDGLTPEEAIHRVLNEAAGLTDPDPTPRLTPTRPAGYKNANAA
jgi:hypothetical protein